LPALAGLIYLLSPIDLIPDFIPVVGYLDDMVILSLLVKLSIRLFPPDVLQESLGKSARQSRRINLILLMMLIALAILIGGFIYLIIKMTKGIV
jgi:uncharacterized membrane protein YkvA (DUF1232 family)